MKYELPSIDQMIEMAVSNPEELERLRAKHIEHAITSAPVHMQQRLRGLQFQIDGKRRVHSTPMGSCIAISKMMLQSVSKLSAALHGSVDNEFSDIERADPKQSSASTSAMIIPFPNKAAN